MSEPSSLPAEQCAKCEKQERQEAVSAWVTAAVMIFFWGFFLGMVCS
jgi:hypothetical protein